MGPACSSKFELGIIRGSSIGRWALAPGGSRADSRISGANDCSKMPHISFHEQNAAALGPRLPFFAGPVFNADDHSRGRGRWAEHSASERFLLKLELPFPVLVPGSSSALRKACQHVPGNKTCRGQPRGAEPSERRPARHPIRISTFILHTWPTPAASL